MYLSALELLPDSVASALANTVTAGAVLGARLPALHVATACESQRRTAHVLSMNATRFSLTAALLRRAGFDVVHITPVPRSGYRVALLERQIDKRVQTRTAASPRGVLSIRLTHQSVWQQHKDEPWLYVFEDDVVLAAGTPPERVPCILNELEALLSQVDHSRRAITYLGTCAAVPFARGLPREPQAASRAVGRPKHPPACDNRLRIKSRGHVGAEAFAVSSITAAGNGTSGALVAWPSSTLPKDAGGGGDRLCACASLCTHAYAIRRELVPTLIDAIATLQHVAATGRRPLTWRKYDIDQLLRRHYLGAGGTWTGSGWIANRRPLAEWPMCIDPEAGGMFVQDAKHSSQAGHDARSNWRR
jgi:hypothetical protein